MKGWIRNLREINFVIEQLWSRKIYFFLSFIFIFPPFKQLVLLVFLFEIE